MNPDELTPIQLLITTIAGLFFSGLFAGTLFIHAWVLVAWNRVRVWQGWLRDRIHDRIGLVDLLACFACVAISQIAIGGLFFYAVNTKSLAQEAQVQEIQGDLKTLLPESPWFMFAVSFSLVLGCVLSAFWTCFRTRETPKRLGMWSGLIPRDLFVGSLVFLWIIPLVLAVNIAVTQATQIEYKHPVIDSLRERSWAFPLLFTSAAIFAPIWEEYAFRFLLVNWLDTIRHNRLDLTRILFGFRPWADGRMPFYRAEGQSESATEAQEVPEAQEAQAVLERFPPWWIAILSGLIFGLAHFEYGVSWVPLVVLGTVLARVYQLQRSILPCILMHGLFNSLAMVGIAVELFVKPPS
ncbi:MAG: CPBP family intramembrane glutamic endopeptidase [Pirellula sp.]